MTPRTIRDGSIRLTFKYAPGSVAAATLDAEREQRRLLAARCVECARTLSPARSLCPTCGNAVDQLVTVGPEATVTAWTNLPNAGTFVLVRPDGSDTAMVHRLIGDPASAVKIGDRVRAVFGTDGLDGFEAVEA